VTRMVLVGRGGLRLHEEIFLAGVRLRGRRAIAEERAEQLLDQALDADRLTLADEGVRTQLTREWNEPESPLRVRLLDSMTRRAETRHQRVTQQLVKRQEADTTRVTEIFSAFRRNLAESLAQLTGVDAQAQLALFPDDQQRQRRRDIEAMSRRLDELGDEERREVDALVERYRDIKPHTTAAAIVFALTPDDARVGGVR
jgi:hypothetical protein